MIDQRGSIESICDEEVKSILKIVSKSGSARSNHYHKTDWHILYVVSGCMDWYERAAGSDEKPSYKQFCPGEYVKVGPMVEHTSKFPVDTVLLCFAGNSRDNLSYEQDVVRTQDLSAL